MRDFTTDWEAPEWQTSQLSLSWHSPVPAGQIALRTGQRPEQTLQGERGGVRSEE